MTGMTDYTARRLLDHATGKTAIFSLPTVYLALFTAVGTDAGSGFTEAAFTSYARKVTSGSDWNAASGSAPSSASNAALLAFATATSTGSDIIAFGLYDASSSGNLLAWDYMGAYSWLPFTCTSASPGVISAPGHGFSNGDKVVVSAEAGGTLPTTGGSWSGLLTVANATTDTFTLGVNTTGTGSGMLRKVVPQAVVANLTIQFAASALVLSGA